MSELKRIFFDGRHARDHARKEARRTPAESAPEKHRTTDCGAEVEARKVAADKELEEIDAVLSEFQQEADKILSAHVGEILVEASSNVTKIRPDEGVGRTMLIGAFEAA